MQKIDLLYRWAIKQERMDNIGQWKHTKAENVEWNKKALSWPVKEDGEINEVTIYLISFLFYKKFL